MPMLFFCVQISCGLCYDIKDCDKGDSVRNSAGASAFHKHFVTKLAKVMITHENRLCKVYRLFATSCREMRIYYGL